MNPFFQNRWKDAHTTLISYLRDALNGELPDDLTALAEEGIRVGSGRPAFRADVAVVESWQRGFPPLWQPEAAVEAEGDLAITATDPYIIDDAEDPSRWIEIRSLSGDLVTVIELLSPANKRDDRIASRDHGDIRLWFGIGKGERVLAADDESARDHARDQVMETSRNSGVQW